MGISSIPYYSVLLDIHNNPYTPEYRLCMPIYNLIRLQMGICGYTGAYMSIWYTVQGQTWAFVGIHCILQGYTLVYYGHTRDCMGYRGIRVCMNICLNKDMCI